MGDGKQKPWYIFVLGALILLIKAFSDELSQHNLIFPAVVLLFVFGFGILLWQGIRQWKKSDEEILAEYQIVHSALPKSSSDPRGSFLRTLLSVAIFIGIVLTNTWDDRPAVTFVFCAVALLLTTAPHLAAWLKRRNSSDETPPRKRIVTSWEIVPFLVGLIPSLFFCFLIGAASYHGAWWFMLPPGLIFLVYFSRPLVAAVRTVVRNYRDSGEQHLRKDKEIEPWDRPDIDPEEYRRK